MKQKQKVKNIEQDFALMGLHRTPLKSLNYGIFGSVS